MCRLSGALTRCPFNYDTVGFGADIDLAGDEMPKTTQVLARVLPTDVSDIFLMVTMAAALAALVISIMVLVKLGKTGHRGQPPVSFGPPPGPPGPGNQPFPQQQPVNPGQQPPPVWGQSQG